MIVHHWHFFLADLGNGDLLGDPSFSDTVPPCSTLLVLGWKYRQVQCSGKYLNALSQHVSAVK